jgi:hypothetical protein
MATVISFDEAMSAVPKEGKCHLLLGNGFSIALKPDIFSYDSLYENADFSKIPHVPKVFSALGTQDFEIVIRQLQDAATVVTVYDSTLVTLITKMKQDAGAIKDALERIPV